MIWIFGSTSVRDNATRIDRALREFGFAVPSLTSDLFLARNNVVRMGAPPILGNVPSLVGQDQV